jgi:hypothetical protein
MKVTIKVFVGVAAILYSLTATSTIISHNGFDLDTDTNIVKGNDLEWLQWDETIGESIEQSILARSIDGWRSATTFEMAALLNSFNFGVTFDGSTNVTQTLISPWTLSEISIHNNFISLFGITNSDAFDINDPLTFSGALSSGPLTIGGQTIFRGGIKDDFYHPLGGMVDHRVAFDSLFEELSYSDNQYGIALVRAPSEKEVNPVPSPPTLTIFILGLLFLSYRRKKSTLGHFIFNINNRYIFNRS